MRVDGRIITDPSYKIAEENPPEISVDGTIAVVRRHIHLMMHKPAGRITAMEDARHPTVADLLPVNTRRRNVSPVGRLDRDTTGLLLLTNDGQLNHRLTSPRWKVDKTYHVTYEGCTIGEADIRRFLDGLRLADDTLCQPAVLEPVSDRIALLTIREGKYHQVKKMMLATGRRVTDLCRISIGPLPLDPALAPGDVRVLTEKETAALYAAVSLPNDAIRDT